MAAQLLGAVLPRNGADIDLQVTHTNLTEVTGMILVDVGPVVVLATSHTTTTGMLAVLSYTSMTGGDVTLVLISLEVSRALRMPLPCACGCLTDG